MAQNLKKKRIKSLSNIQSLLSRHFFNEEISNKSPLNGSPSNKSPLNGSPSNKSPLNGSPSNKSPLNGSHISYKCLSRFDAILIYAITQTATDELAGYNKQLVDLILKHTHGFMTNAPLKHLLSEIREQPTTVVTTTVDRSMPSAYSIELETYWDVPPAMNVTLDLLYLTTKNTIIGLDRYDNSCFKHTITQQTPDYTFKVDILVTNLMTHDKHRLFNIDNMNTLMDTHSSSGIRQVVGCWKGVSIPECYIELDKTSISQFNNMVSPDKQISIEKHYLEISRRYPLKITTKHEPPSFVHNISTVSNAQEYKKFHGSPESRCKLDPTNLSGKIDTHLNEKYLNFIEIFLNDTRILGTISYSPSPSPKPQPSPSPSPST